MNHKESLDLKKLIGNFESEYVDNTENIRKLKHSVKIQNDLSRFIKFKKENATLYAENPEQFEMDAQVAANFLYLNYTDLFRRLVKDELNLAIFAKFLHVLKGIEDGKVDQHEASVLIGKVLKELYLDSAVRHGENLDKKYASENQEEQTPKNEGRAISWKDFKNDRMTNDR